MASLIHSYEYDIFISYRQKDNKGDKWVSEFVAALKTELESTFKEDVSLYFDENPHDRLQETHNVDKSLEGKLKCLIFIPILSQTYCDPGSYAWQYEFLTFLRMAESDRFGKDVKLRSGNFAGRILPIRIHDLEQEDIKLFEKETGSVLRALDFVFKTSSGVNRPLTPSDDPDKNLNRIFYRDQINKVAHAIKEIIIGMKTGPVPEVKEKDQARESLNEVKEEGKKIDVEKTAKSGKNKLISTVALVALLVIAGIITYPKIFKVDTLEKLRSSGEKISVAVMPFLNITKDSIWNNWQDGIKDELINYLTNYNEELVVRQTPSVNGVLQSKGLTNYASLTPSVARNISKILEADVFITGSIKQAGSILRVNAQLNDTRTENALKSFQIEGPFKEESIFHITDSLSVMIKNYLLITKLEKDFEKRTSPSFLARGVTNSPEAYRSYFYGMNAIGKADWPNAVKWLLNAISIDSTSLYAAGSLVLAYRMAGKVDSAKILCRKLYDKRNQMPYKQQLEIIWENSWLNETPNEEIRYIRQLLELDDQDMEQIRNLGDKYFELNQYDNAIREYEKAQKIYNKLGIKPLVPWFNYRLGIAYHNNGQYKEEKKLYEKAEQDFPDNSGIIQRQAILELAEGDTVAGNKFIEKYISLSKTGSIAFIYSEAGILDRAEKYYRQALSIQPESTGRMNTLAYFLIDKDRNINGGLQLVDTALKLSHDNFNYLHTKGWGLYKQGKYQEALDILQKSWDLRKRNSLYDHNAFAHLDSAKKAVAKMNN